MAKRPDLLPGTLDMLILKTLTRAPLHGYGIAQSIKRLSDDVLTVEEGSLYPALQRLLLQGWVKAEWKMTDTNRRARFYTLTAAGRKQLGLEVSQFEQMITAIGRVHARCAGGLSHESPEQIPAAVPAPAVRCRTGGRDGVSPRAGGEGVCVATA